MIERATEHRFRAPNLAPRDARAGLCRGEHRRQVDVPRFPVVNGIVGLEQVGAPDEVVEPAGTQPRHDLPRLFGDKEEVGDDVLRGALEALAQGLVLGGDADRAGVLRWQTRIMMQPVAMRGAVEKPISSAPSSPAITTSRPVLICPSTWTVIRDRKSLRTRVCCVSASPSSHGTPADWIELSGEEPVPRRGRRS